jgi:DNA polymerase IV (archaeal DinB-like DNA polymerase)
MVIAHVDMDCFFAACEVKKNPTLKGKPVIVGATKDRGVVCAANYEARKYKVHSALPISIAKRRCPNGTYLPVNGTLYKKESNAVMQILSAFADEMQQVSVDEAYLDLTTFSLGKTWEEVGKIIQNEILTKVGLSCSIGISLGKTVSKIASDFKKPAGVTIVKDVKEFLSPLLVEKFPGIGKKSLPYYHQNKIKTLGDLAKKSRFFILEKFGMHGIRIQQICRGENLRGIVHRGHAKSSSRERTFLKDEDNLDILKEVLLKLCLRVLDDIDGKDFKRVSIKIRYADFSTITRDKTLVLPINKGFEKYVLELFKKNYNGLAVRLLGVKLSNFVNDKSKQTKLIPISL